MISRRFLLDSYFRYQVKTMDFSSELISGYIWIDRYRNSIVRKELKKKKIKKRKRIIFLVNSLKFAMQLVCISEIERRSSVHDYMQSLIDLKKNSF